MRKAGRAPDTLDLTEGAESRLRESSRRLGQSDRERELFLSKLIEAEERERRRLAHEIHDDPLQAMTAVRTGLNVLGRNAPMELRRRIFELEERARDAIIRLRRVLFDVRPPGLDRRGLVPVLRASLEQMRAHTGVKCRLTTRLAHEPPIELRVILFRIASEALANVRKHAEATHVDVLVEHRHEGVRLRIRDDGRGFPPERATGRPGHLGLEVMRERAELTGGRLRVETAPGEGTTVECWIPTPAHRRAPSPR